MDVQKRVKKILDNFRDCKDEFGIMDITRFAVLFGFNINESRDLPNDINGKIISTNNNKNIILRRINIKEGKNLLWLKMRPDTPQHYEYISVEDINGKIDSFININPWTQFYDLKDREDVPLSYADNVVMKNCECECNTFFDVKTDESQYVLSDFTFENLKINAKVNGFNENAIQNVKIKNIDIQKLL